MCIVVMWNIRVLCCEVTTFNVAHWSNFAEAQYFKNVLDSDMSKKTV